MGTKWITNDVITFARMNQKTLIVQAAQPAIMYAGMLWFDIDDDKLKEKNAANDAWIERPGVTLAATISGLWTFDRGAAPPFAVDAASTRVVNLIADVHAPEHKDGGADELDVSELAGAIGGAGEIPETDGAAVTWVDPDLRYDPKLHAATHKDGGTDELDVSELAGAIGGAGEVPETDGAAVTWVDPDGRYDPKGHHAIHEDGGADEIEIDDLPGANGAAGEIVESDGSAMSFVEPDGRYNPKEMDPSPDANNTGSELHITTDTVGENVDPGEVLYLKGDGKYWLADADGVATMPALVMAMETILADAAGKLLHSGYFRHDAWNWAPGNGEANLLWAAVTPGAMSQTQPVGAGDQAQVLGYVRTADIVYFNPSYELVEVPA